MGETTRRKPRSRGKRGLERGEGGGSDLLRSAGDRQLVEFGEPGRARAGDLRQPRDPDEEGSKANVVKRDRVASGGDGFELRFAQAKGGGDVTGQIIGRVAGRGERGKLPEAGKKRVAGLPNHERAALRVQQHGCRKSHAHGTG